MAIAPVIGAPPSVVFFVLPLAVHPALWLDLQEPILGRGSAAKIFADMLFSHVAHGNLFPVAVHDGTPNNFSARKIPSA